MTGSDTSTVPSTQTPSASPTFTATASPSISRTFTPTLTPSASQTDTPDEALGLWVPVKVTLLVLVKDTAGLLVGLAVDESTAVLL